METERENRNVPIVQERLISFRMFKRITQEEMAQVIGVDLRTYINKEKGISQFKLNEAFAIAVKLEMNLDEIFINPNFIKHEVS